jgi:hypothetical protein
MGKEARIADTGFLLLALAAGVATVMDIESTVHAQHDPEAAEVNLWIYGERPGRARMYAINIPITATLTGLAYSWKRQYSRGPTPWAWRLPLIALAIGHGAAAIANYFNFPGLRMRAGLPGDEP